jgi:hypothetical protein
VLSLYVSVPLDLPALRGLPARADDLLSGARSAAAEDHYLAQARDADWRLSRRMLKLHARKWLGRTVAIFACPKPRLAAGQADSPAASGVRSTRFGGWYGPEAHRVNARVIDLARRHYRDELTDEIRELLVLENG